MAVMDSYDGIPDLTPDLTPTPTPSPTPGAVLDQTLDPTPDPTPDPSLDASVEPFTPVRPSSPDGPLPSAIGAGESIAPIGTASSSRPFRGRWLAGLLAISMLSAVVGSVGTVGLLTGFGAADRATGTATVTGTTTSASTTSASTSSVNVTSSDAVVAVAESASPAVVTLTVESAGRSAYGPFSLPSTGVGSGFIFDASGLILTNAHVIEGAGQITVAFKDGTELPGTVVVSDTKKDLAVVKVTAPKALPTIPIGDASALKVGQQVIAIGSPLGTFTESVTSGILSATGRSIEVGSETSRRTTSMTGLLQTDASINPGNSGGPLLDDTGKVIGVNAAVAASAQGIGFAVPIDVAADIMAQARAKTGTA
jgi:S1-C subfamily serine protease